MFQLQFDVYLSDFKLEMSSLVIIQRQAQFGSEHGSEW